jgi:gliotoxin/aspirochlorine biosynthesis peptide synthetase
VNIGRALPGLSIYVLDHRQCLVPKGVTGEIYISGEQVVHGYWSDNHKDKTTAHFVPNPFSSEPSKRIMYRTGDLGFWNEDMNITYVGRLDNQVKVRGFRVELEEVENAIISADSGAQQAAVITVDGPEDDESGLRIVALVTPKDVDIAALRARLTLLLPSYARPSQVLAVSELPKTANFKLDREKIQSLVLAVQQEGMDYQATTSGYDGAQLSPTEKLVAEAWSKVLGLSERICIHKQDDFLDLGGNSILAIRAARSITTSLGRTVPVPLLIRETILGKVARAIDQFAVPRSSTSPVEAQNSGSYLHPLPDGVEVHGSRSEVSAYPLSDREQDLFKAHSLAAVKSAFNTTAQFILHGPINIETLAEAFKALIQDNPILRARYKIVEGHVSRIIGASITLPRIHIGDEFGLEKLQYFVNQPFDISHDQLIRVILWDRNGKSTETEVVMIIHHIITDKESMALMLQRLSRNYRNLLRLQQKQPIIDNHQPETHTSNGHSSNGGTYLDWAQWQEDHKSGSQIEKDDRFEFWKQHLQGMPTLPHLKLESRGHRTGFPTLTQSVHIPHVDDDASVVKSAVAFAYSQRIAVAATALAMYAIFGTRDLVLGLPHMNRDEHGTASMLGLFVDEMPIRILLDDRNLINANTLLDAVTAEVNMCMGNWLPSSQIRSAVALSNNAIESDSETILDIMIVYGWSSDSIEQNVSLGEDIQVDATSNKVKPTGSMFPLEFDFSELADGSLLVELTHNTELVSLEQAEALVAFLPVIAQGIAKRVAPATILSCADMNCFLY